MSYSDYNTGQSRTIVPQGTKVYSDLDVSLTKHPAYFDITPLKDIEAVKNSVRNLLLTNRGERPFQPDVGSDLTAMLFEQLNPFTMESIRMKIKDMIASYEPRVNNVGVQIEDNEFNSIRVSVTFNIIGISENESLDFYLERLR